MAKPPVIIEKFYGFLTWLFERTAQYPRAYRYSLGEKIQNTGISFLEYLISAAYQRNKKTILAEANRELEILRFLLRLSKDLRCISARQYEHARRECAEVGNQLGGWIKNAMKK